MKQTTKAFASTGVALCAAGLLALAAAWVGRDEEKKTEQKEKSAKLFEVDKAKVREVRLFKKGALVAAVRRVSPTSTWLLFEPIQADADDAAINGVVDRLAELKQKGEVEGMDPALAGLAEEAKANLAATLVEEGGRTSTLLLGEVNPFDQSLYVRRGGEKLVRVVASYEKSAFEKELFDLRDKRVAHLDDAAEIRRIEYVPPLDLTKQGPPKPRMAYTLERQAGVWRIASPEPGPADGTVADRLVSSIKSLRATRVAEEKAEEPKLATYGLSSRMHRVLLTVAVAGGKETFQRTLLVAQPESRASPDAGVAVKTYAKRDDSPTVFEVDGQILQELAKEPFDLQDKTVVTFDREAVRRLELGPVAPGSPPLVVARSKSAPVDGGTAEESFEVTAPVKGPAKRWKASGDLYALLGLKAAAFGPTLQPDAADDGPLLARLGLGPTARAIAVFGDGDRLLARLWIGGEAGVDKLRRYVRAEGARRVVEVEKSALDAFSKSSEELLEAPPPAAASAPSSSSGTVGETSAASPK
jgi:hypothetical protein